MVERQVERREATHRMAQQINGAEAEMVEQGRHAIHPEAQCVLRRMSGEGRFVREAPAGQIERDDATLLGERRENRREERACVAPAMQQHERLALATGEIVQTFATWPWRLAPHNGNAHRAQQRLLGGDQRGGLSRGDDGERWWSSGHGLAILSLRRRNSGGFLTLRSIPRDGLSGRALFYMSAVVSACVGGARQRTMAAWAIRREG